MVNHINYRTKLAILIIIKLELQPTSIHAKGFILPTSSHQQCPCSYLPETKQQYVLINNYFTSVLNTDNQSYNSFYTLQK